MDSRKEPLIGKRFIPKAKSRQDELPIRIFAPSGLEGYWVVKEEGGDVFWDMSEKLIDRDYEEVKVA